MSRPRMEAGNPKRAVLRLVATGGGLLLTVLLVVVTIVVLVGGQEEPASAVASESDWDLIETGESYQLPIAEITPVSAAPRAELAPYEPPAYVEPQQSAASQPTLPVEAVAVAEQHGWHGPVTIHNPAAFGPPEDGSLPSIPTRQLAPTAAPRMAARQPVAPRLAPAEPPVKPPAVWEDLEDSYATRSTAPEAEPVEIEESIREQLALNREARELHDLAMQNDQELLSYTTSTNDLSKRLTAEVQAGFQLGKSGAVYAARAKFVSVLRRIALAKDAEEGSSRHATALAEGLRTLDDADDFVPRGDALEAELDVASIASSHGLRLVSDDAREGAVVAPHQAIARYSQHAANKLSEAAGAEPAGSMALYGLGKTYARLEAQGGETTAGRKSLVMYRAAIDTHDENYLAANELGVRLARDGRYEQAGRVLRQAASQPTAIATVHENLAAIETRLGRSQEAVLAQDYSQQLAQQERAAGDVSRRHGVQWVDPNAFRRAGPMRGSVQSSPTMAGPAGQQFVPQQAMSQQAMPQQAMPQQMMPPPYQLQQGYAVAPPQQEPGGWTGFVRTAKRTVGWSSPAPAAQQAYARPPVSVPQGQVLR